MNIVLCIWIARHVVSGLCILTLSEDWCPMSHSSWFWVSTSWTFSTSGEVFLRVFRLVWSWTSWTFSTTGGVFLWVIRLVWLFNVVNILDERRGFPMSLLCSMNSVRLHSQCQGVSHESPPIVRNVWRFDMCSRTLWHYLRRVCRCSVLYVTYNIVVPTNLIGLEIWTVLFEKWI